MHCTRKVDQVDTATYARLTPGTGTPPPNSRLQWCTAQPTAHNLGCSDILYTTLRLVYATRLARRLEPGKAHAQLKVKVVNRIQVLQQATHCVAGSVLSVDRCSLNTKHHPSLVTRPAWVAYTPKKLAQTTSSEGLRHLLEASADDMVQIMRSATCHNDWNQSDGRVFLHTPILMESPQIGSY